MSADYNPSYREALVCLKNAINAGIVYAACNVALLLTINEK